MKLLSLTTCCFILQVRSQFNFQQYNYPNNGYVPLSAKPENIYIADQLARDSTTQNGYTQSQQAIETQLVDQTVPAPSASGSANFNSWYNKLDNSRPNVVSRNGADLNRVQERAVTNENQALLNQNQDVSNTNTQIENNDDLDLSVLIENSGQTSTVAIESQTQVPPHKDDVNGIFNLGPNEGTLTFVKPKIDAIGPSVTDFGINLLKTLGDLRDENVVISPLSISTCLALLQQGARGTTESQISNALRLSPESSRVAYKAIANDIKKRSSTINTLKTSNNVFMTKNFEINVNFSRIAREDFRSTISTVDYSQPIRAAELINKWVALETRDKITHIVSPQHVGPTTQMNLVNVVYFKGLWDTPISETKTTKGEFQLSNGQKKIVSYMHTKRYLRGGIEPASNAMIMIMPFSSDEYSLMWILPPQGSNLNEYIKTLSADELLEFREFPSLRFDIEVPKFTVKTDNNLIPVLKNMGISDMFGPYADLSRVGGNKLYNSPLSVSSVLHSALIGIDEKGGSGAGTTSFAAVALVNSTPLKFKAYYPFLVILWDHASAAPLYMAKIFDPSEHD
ncbi:hypothetical protein K1T71_012257 [Dendrolimus kikuchii]|uniref:Uncharacterized protein n=1 Tax=Dendrolimus kikuchii TaxID=765133 RepID=A0ACC1CLH4_9NEOP|nr:hypothetical protein K1T71_012257 [Dendrolimus kikuchii]